MRLHLALGAFALTLAAQPATATFDALSTVTTKWPETVTPAQSTDDPLFGLAPQDWVSSFVKDFHDMANRPGSCVDLGQFYAPTIVVVGKTRSRAEQIRQRCDIARRNPQIFLDESSVVVTDVGDGQYRVTYDNRSEIDQNGRRVGKDWRVTAIVQDRGGKLQFTRIDLAAR